MTPLQAYILVVTAALAVGTASLVRALFVVRPWWRVVYAMKILAASSLATVFVASGGFRFGLWPMQLWSVWFLYAGLFVQSCVYVLSPWVHRLEGRRGSDGP